MIRTHDSTFQPLLEAIARRPARIKVSGLIASAPSLLLARLAKSGHPFCLITATQAQAQTAFQELQLFLNLLRDDEEQELSPMRALLFPPWDILAYEPGEARPDWMAQRLATLQQLDEGPAAVITTIEGFLQRVLSKRSLNAHCETVCVGDTVSRESLIKRLLDKKYEACGSVSVPGEFSQRGGIVDVFPPGVQQPRRIEFFGDEVESIRPFDPETQRSSGREERLVLLPGREDLFDPLYQQSAFSDYLTSDTLIVLSEPERLNQHGKRFLIEAEDASHFAIKRDPRHPSFAELFLPLTQLQEAALGRCAIDIETLVMKPEKGVSRFNFDTIGTQALGFARPGQGFSEACERLNTLRKDSLIFLLVKNIYQAERFGRLFSDHDVPWSRFDPSEPDVNGPELSLSRLTAPAPILIHVGPLNEGFALDAQRWVFLTEDALTGGSATRRSQPKKKSAEAVDKQLAFLKSFEDLKPGSYVVHMDHGVGQYLGLKRLTIRQGERDKGIDADFIVLQYASRDKVYVPLDKLNLVQPYVGLDGKSPKMDKLGGSRWAKTKAKVKGEIKEMTGELLQLYSEREVLEGHAFATAPADAEAFAAAFEFEETPDQLRTIQEVLADMERKKPMDRLVCGDVGFGKTEVAMRAAFHAVMDGKQVAVIVPTTLLAHQHQDSFLKRFAPFPIEVAVISRFLSRAEQRDVCQRLNKGTVDILIGTHRLLSKDVIFRDLGLIVVDEEHRFGVRHKERLKQMRKEVDVLTLTATPIPRTLQMALAEVRDLSVIETPPADRLAIRTILSPFDPSIIREVVFRELVRGGQVFFLHNRVQNIEHFGKDLAELLPEAKIGIAHGQMREKVLEKVMQDFLDKKTNLLLTTTIIESGIDIPSANTIIINNADRFGLSELYQLRGRVGRSGEQAYAYLLVKEDRILTEDARKRLQAIQEFTELGSGFRVAARDLEIRGAGNLLGQEQSGQIAAVGFEMYLEMIKEAVQKIKGGPIQVKREPSLHFRVSSYLPESYVPDSLQRLSLYKRLSSARDLDDVMAIQNEVEDRYGPPPEPAANLLQIIQLKTLCKACMIVKLEERGPCVRFTFEETGSANAVDPAALLKLFPAQIQFLNPISFELTVKSTSWEDIFLETAFCLKSMSKKTKTEPS